MPSKPAPAKRVARAAALLFLPAWAGVFGGEVSQQGTGINIWDKAEHFGAYFVLALLASMAAGSRRAVLWAGLGLVVMGGLLEILQGLIGRDCDIHDEYANTLGVISGVILGRAIIALLVRMRRAD